MLINSAKLQKKLMCLLKLATFDRNGKTSAHLMREERNSISKELSKTEVNYRKICGKYRKIH